MGRPGAKDDAKDADRLAYYRFVHGAVRRADAPSNQRNKWKIVKITLTHISARPNINCKMTFRVRGCARAPDCESGREKGARPGRVVRAGRPIVVFFAVFGTVDVAESISRCWGWFWVKDGARSDDVLWWAVIADKMSPDCFRLDFFFFFFFVCGASFVVEHVCGLKRGRYNRRSTHPRSRVAFKLNFTRFIDVYDVVRMQNKCSIVNF